VPDRVLDQRAAALPRQTAAITRKTAGELLRSISIEAAAAEDEALTDEQRRELGTAWTRTAASPPIPMVVLAEDDDGNDYEDDVLARFAAYVEAPSSRSHSAPVTGWIVGGYLRLAPSGEVTIGQLELQPLDNKAASVTGTVLRSFRVEELLARALAQLEDAPAVMSVLERHGLRRPSEEEKSNAERAAKAAARHERRRGRAGYPESHYRRVALDYLELQKDVRRGIRQRLAERYGVNAKTVGDWIHRAHELGFLGSGHQGRAGREAGPRLYAETPPPLGHSGTTRDAARSRKAVQDAARRR
jgi:hypothetical protein